MTRRTLLAAGLASMLWLSATGSASAQFIPPACHGDFLLSDRACEAGHHIPLISVVGGITAIIALIGSGLLDPGGAGTGCTAGQTTKPERAPGATPETAPEPRPITPADLGLPPADAWDNPIFVSNGEYPGSKPGQVWWDGHWVDPTDDIREHIREGFEAVGRRDAEREQFIEESRRASGEWMQERVKANEADAARERAERERRDRAWDQINRIEDIADRRGYGDIRQRATDGAFNEDGSLDVDYVERLGEALRGRIGRDVAAPEESLQPGWVGDFVGETIDDARKNPLIRIGAGILSGGSSEVVYQGMAAADKIREEVNRAVDSGRDYSTTDAIRTGARVLADENLPVNTIKTLADPNATWGQVAGSVAADIFTAADTLETARNALGGFRAARNGAGLGDVLTHREPGLFDNLLGRSDDGNKLWRDPMDIDWQTGGPRAGLDLDGLHGRGATVDANAARGLAGPPVPELHPPGGVQTKLPEDWGMRRSDAIHVQQVAADELVQIDMRPTTGKAPELLDSGAAVPKPPEIKVKTVNEIDVEFLGRPPHTEGMAAHFDPPMPGSPPGTRPPNVDEGTWDRVMDRYDQRHAEFVNNQQSVRDLEGWRADPDGVLRNADGQAATGDYDPFEIRNFDGTPVSPEVKQRVIDRLMDGPANVQHGAHLDWPAQARADFEAGLRPSPDLTPKEAEIYDRIVRSHQEGGEALIQFGAGQPRIETGFTTADVISR